MNKRGDVIVEPAELADRIGDAGLRIVDGSWYLPAQGRDGRAEFEQTRIPGTVYFDIDAISDSGVALPHMLPSPQDFAADVGRLGISETDDIVVYDGPGLFSCARVWWMFRIMGANRVRVLDGGFDNWRKAGLPVETGPPAAPEPAVFHPHFDDARVKSIADIRANLKSGAAAVLDARPFGRFAGTEPEPRPGLRQGHIPGSHSLPATALVADGRLKDEQQIRQLFRQAGLAGDRPAITSCGSGVTAAVISLALEAVGHANHALYDGSWAEWGQAADAPVAQWLEGEERSTTDD